MKKEEKTNVMRLLDQKKIPYKSYCYLGTGAVGGMEVAETLHEDPDQVFKTLVTKGRSSGHYVFVIPVNCGLDLKKAAGSVGEKSIEMIRQKELLPLTGYVHGGCSPIGMKKQLPTVVDIKARSQGTILFSAGKIGYQVEVAVDDLARIIPVTFADVSHPAPAEK